MRPSYISIFIGVLLVQMITGCRTQPAMIEHSNVLPSEKFIIESEAIRKATARVKQEKNISLDNFSIETSRCVNAWSVTFRPSNVAAPDAFYYVIIYDNGEELISPY